MDNNILDISLASVLAEINSLQQELNSLDSSTEAYANTQSRLISLLNTFSSESEKATAATSNFDSSIKQSTEKLDQLNTSTGKSVVNFTELGTKLGAMSSLVSSLGGSVGSLGTVMQSFSAVQVLTKTTTDAATASANAFNVATGGILIAVGAVIAIIQKLIEHIKSNEEQSNKLKVAMAKLEPIFLAVEKVIHKAADGLLRLIDFIGTNLPKAIAVVVPIIAKFVGIWVDFYKTIAEGVDNLAEFAGIESNLGKGMQYLDDKLKSVVKWSQELTKESAKSAKFAQEEVNNIEKQRQTKLQIAQIDKDSAELRRKSQQGDKKALEELKQLTKERYDLELQQSERNAALESKRQSLSPSSTKDLDKLAELQTLPAKIAAEREKALSSIDKLEERLDTKSRQRTTKRIEDTSKEEEKALKEREKQEIETSKRIYQMNVELRKGLSSGTSSNLEDLQLQRDRLEAQNQLTLENETNLQKQKHEIQLKGYEDQLYLVNKALEDTNLREEERTKLIEDQANLRRQIEVETERQKIDEIKSIYSDIDTIWSNYDSANALTEEGQPLDPAEYSIQAIARLREAREQGLIDGQEYLDGIAQISAQEAAIRLKNYNETKRTEEDKAKAIKKAQDKAISLAAAGIGALGKMMADKAKQDVKNGKISEEEGRKQFEAGKKMQIASAIVSTLSGAVESQMAVWKTSGLPFWAALPLSIATGLQTLMSGYSQIDQIRQQQWDSDSNSSSSAAQSHFAGNTSTMHLSTPEINPLINEDRDIQQLATVPIQDKSEQRVYILESDIQESNQRVEIRESNTTF